MAKDNRCRHNRVWVVNGGWGMWCFECGAYRKMLMGSFGNVIYPGSKWQKPVGRGGKNPWEDFGKSESKYRTRFVEFL